MSYVLPATFENYINQAYQQAFATYDWAKHSNSYMESTLYSVEQKVTGAAHLVGQRATDTFVNYYIKPKEVIAEAYFNGMEKGKSAAVETGTLALAVAVLTGQKGLQLTAGGTALLLDGIMTATQKSSETVRAVQEVVEQKIHAGIQEIERITNNPIETATEAVHSFLDILMALVEKMLKISIHTNPSSTISERVKALAHAIAAVLFKKAQEITDPLQEKTHQLVDNLSRGFDLAIYVREQKQWALEKMEGMSTAVFELKEKFETEAKKIGTEPEKILMTSIRNQSLQLKEALETLKNRSQKMFGEENWINNPIEYLQELDEQLGEVEDIYQIRDDIISDAHMCLQEISEWIANLLNHREPSSQ